MEEGECRPDVTVENVMNRWRTLFQPGKTAVVLQDVYFEYDTLRYTGGFRGQVELLKIQDIDEVIMLNDRGTRRRRQLCVELHVRIFDNKGHENDPRWFVLEGINPDHRQPDRSVFWHNGMLIALIKHVFKWEPDKRKDFYHFNMPGVSTGTKCKASCKRGRDDLCTRHFPRYASEV